MNGDAAATVKCRQCGYDLRGLDPDGGCPECGILIAFSLRDDTLACSEPAYVRLLAKGMLLLLASAVAPVALSIVSMVARPLVGPVSVVLSLIGLWGAWLLTTPDPSGLGEEKYGRWRRAARLVAVIGVVSSGLQQLLNYLSVGMVIQLASTLLGLGLGLASIFLLLYLERLSERLSDRQKGEKLARRAVGLRWLVIVFYGCVALGGVVVAVFGGLRGGMNPGLGGFGAPMMCGACAFGVIAIWMSISWLILMVGFRAALAEEAAEAESRWNATAAGGVRG